MTTFVWVMFGWFVVQMGLSLAQLHGMHPSHVGVRSVLLVFETCVAVWALTLLL